METKIYYTVSNSDFDILEEKRFSSVHEMTLKIKKLSLLME